VRIGLVCPYSVTEPGGVQAQVLGLARELRALHHDVAVLAPVDGAIPDGVERMARSVRIPVNGSIAPMAPHPTALWRTHKRIRSGPFDVLHLHEPLAPSITIPALLTRSAPTVGTFHAAGERTPYERLGPVPRVLARRVDVRVAVSEAAAHLARRHLGGSYHVLFNGIDEYRYGTASTPARAARRTVLFLGRDEPRKGLDVLLDAMRELPDDVMLLVVGGRAGKDGRPHARGVDRRVRWLGRLSDDDKIALLASASVLCAPSLRGESFGMVLLEAMAAGTPAVVSDIPGYRSVSDGGRAALLVPPGDSSALAAALRRLLADEGLAERLRRAGRVRVRAFTMTALAARYVDLYERAVEERAVARR
jgi:phosphatidylinositol alpha-mannosyltransferase